VSTFADTSALVKLYADEAGDDAIRALSSLVVSQVSRAELPAALWRKHRMAVLTARQASLLVTDFELDYYGTQKSAPRFQVVPASDLIFDVAARLTGVHGLRVYDAVQLATAQLVRSADADCRSFAAFDNDLRVAAAGEGFDLIP
jgi:predicted nucleic acid-binding protein